MSKNVNLFKITICTPENEEKRTFGNDQLKLLYAEHYNQGLGSFAEQCGENMGEV